MTQYSNLPPLSAGLGVDISIPPKPIKVIYNTNLTIILTAVLTMAIAGAGFCAGRFTLPQGSTCMATFPTLPDKGE